MTSTNSKGCITGLEKGKRKSLKVYLILLGFRQKLAKDLYWKRVLYFKQVRAMPMCSSNWPMLQSLTAEKAPYQQFPTIHVCCTVASRGGYSWGTCSSRPYTSDCQSQAMASCSHYSGWLPLFQFPPSKHPDYFQAQVHAISCSELLCGCRRWADPRASFLLSQSGASFPFLLVFGRH